MFAPLIARAKTKGVAASTTGRGHRLLSQRDFSPAKDAQALGTGPAGARALSNRSTPESALHNRALASTVNSDVAFEAEGRGDDTRAPKDGVSKGEADVTVAAPASSSAPVTPHCKVASGPTYAPSGTLTPTISGGRKSFPFSMAATFANLAPAAVFPPCCEVHQFIKWDARYVASKGGPPHGGFPSSAAADTWVEDRDQSDKRYGHRSGSHSDPIAGGGDEYTTGGVRDQLNGDAYAGKDAPSAAASRTGTWQFRLDVVDTCNGNATKASSPIITVPWG